MFRFNEAELSSLAIHKLGVSANDEDIEFSKQTVTVDEDINQLLKKFFLKPFKPEGLFTFNHETDLNLNEIYHYSQSIFSNPASLFLQSVNIAKHLYEQSKHPNIKPGELYVAYFENCLFYDEVVDAVGIFKSENKDTYLKVFPSDGGFGISGSEGININKLDKGCLIFNTESATGYRIAIVDNTNKSNEAQYWMLDFLNIKPNQDSYYHTKNYINLCKNFAEDAFPEADKVDKIDLVNNAVSYFAKNNEFNIQEFSKAVIHEEALKDKFNAFKKEFAQSENLETINEFQISKKAVTQSKRYIKSVIKLDKNFHVYVHGNRQNIVRGFDEKLDMNTYTLYFKEES